MKVVMMKKVMVKTSLSQKENKARFVISRPYNLWRSFLVRKELSQTSVYFVFIYFQNLGGGSDVGYANSEDCSKFVDYGKLKDWKEKKVCESIRNRFTTGDWDEARLRNQNLGPGDKGENDELYGDFEDLETGEKHNSHENMELDENQNEDVEVVERRLKKLALRAKFDKEYPFITE